jgi:hypothetical protein
MQKHEVRNCDQALAYITDCCLATVEYMAMLKNPAKSEFSRHINIAQIACDWLDTMHIDYVTTRATSIIGIQSVEKWAIEIHNTHHPKL